MKVRLEPHSLTPTDAKHISITILAATHIAERKTIVGMTGAKQNALPEVERSSDEVNDVEKEDWKTEKRHTLNNTGSAVVRIEMYMWGA